jgi:branched-chain amino acid aminotransferase
MITLAKDMGLTVMEQNFTRDQLYIAEEIFLSGTAAEVVGVRMIDFRSVNGGGIGPITHSLCREYDQTVRGKGTHSEEWLDYVHGN